MSSDTCKYRDSASPGSRGPGTLAHCSVDDWVGASGFKTRDVSRVTISAVRGHNIIVYEYLEARLPRAVL